MSDLLEYMIILAPVIALLDAVITFYSNRTTARQTEDRFKHISRNLENVSESTRMLRNITHSEQVVRRERSTGELRM